MLMSVQRQKPGEVAGNDSSRGIFLRPSGILLPAMPGNPGVSLGRGVVLDLETELGMCQGGGLGMNLTPECTTAFLIKLNL